MLVVKEITIPSFGAQGRGCLQAEDGQISRLPTGDWM